MGMEIRRVPKGWEHPVDERGYFKPMFEEAYTDMLNEWWENHQLWLQGKHPDQVAYPERTGYCAYYAEWTDEAPRLRDYNPVKWAPEEAICFQVYENVSMGTPISPVFDTLQQVEDWLVTERNFTIEEAKELCQYRSRPTFSMLVSNHKDLFGLRESKPKFPHGKQPPPNLRKKRGNGNKP